MDTLKSRQPPHTCRVTDAFGSALIFGRYSSSSAWQALSEAESPGPPEAPAVYLQRHSRATFSKETPVSPMSAIRTARVRRAVEGTSRDGEEEKRASMSADERGERERRSPWKRDRRDGTAGRTFHIMKNGSVDLVNAFYKNKNRTYRNKNKNRT